MKTNFKKVQLFVYLPPYSDSTKDQNPIISLSWAAKDWKDVNEQIIKRID